MWSSKNSKVKMQTLWGQSRVASPPPLGVYSRPLGAG